MLVYIQNCGSAPGVYRATLHSPREAECARAQLGESQEGRVTSGQVAFQLAKGFWRPEPPHYKIAGGCILKSEEDTGYISTRVLNRKRAGFQGADFRFPVGEVVSVTREGAGILYEELPRYGVSKQSIGALRRIAGRARSLQLHVVHFADHERGNPYLNLENSRTITSVCCALRWDKDEQDRRNPYYETVPEGLYDGFHALVFLPKALFEGVGELHDNPKPLPLVLD